MATNWTSFGSDLVNIFPSAYRTYKVQGKFTSERNFTNLIESVVDSKAFSDSSDGYVVDYKDGSLEVVIHGYYFNVRTALSENLWLGIKVAKNSNRLAPYAGQNGSTELDDSGSFLGLVYINSSNPPIDLQQSDADHNYYMLRVTDNRGDIVSRQKFVTDSVLFKATNKQSKTLTEELDNKQYKLKAGEGIADITNSQTSDNIVKLDDETLKKLNSMSGGKGSPSRPVYVDSEGKINPLTDDVGKLIVSNDRLEYTSIILKGDTGLTEGVTIYASENTPSDSVGKNGDIWFKYTR